MLRNILFAVVLSLLASCDTSSPPKIVITENTTLELSPLSPYTEQYTTQAYGSSRSDYFFTFRGSWQDSKYRTLVMEAMINVAANVPRDFDLYSIETHEKSNTLNKNFKGNSIELSSTYDDSLISFFRWRKGKMDVAYLVEKGQVVYDLLEGKVMMPPQDFD